MIIIIEAILERQEEFLRVDVYLSVRNGLRKEYVILYSFHFIVWVHYYTCRSYYWTWHFRSERDQADTFTCGNSYKESHPCLRSCISGDWDHLSICLNFHVFINCSTFCIDKSL